MLYTDKKMTVNFLYIVCIHKNGNKSQMILPHETNINSFIPELMCNTDIAIVNYYYTKDWEYLYNFRWFINHTFKIECLI